MMERDYQPQRYSREGRKEPHAVMERERERETGKSHMQ